MSEDDDLERSSEDGTDALVGAALLGLVALVALGFFGHGLLEAWWASGWLEAPGRVVEVDVRERHGRRGPSFIPEVRVAFEVDGRRYECRRERLGARVGDRDEDEAWERVAHLPVGATVTVHYDPLDPSRSVLEPTVELAGTLLAGFLGLLTGAVAAGLLRRGLQPAPRLRRRRRGGAAPEAVT